MTARTQILRRLARGPGLLHILLATLLLLVPVAINGRPTTFFDTMDYLHEGEAAASLAHVRLPGLVLTPPTPEAREQYGVERAIRASRSAAYGLFVYLTFRIGGLWLTAALQALAAASVIYAFVRAVAGRASRGAFWAAMIGVTAATALPFYCGFAMPDVFAPIGALAMTALVVGADHLANKARAALFVAAVACASMHTSHVLMALALAVVALGVRGWLARDVRSGLAGAAWIASAALVSIVMFGGYSTLVRLETGVVIRSPPFVSARLLMDGPGRTYLAKACAGGRRPFTLCDYKTRNLSNSDDVLWSRSRRVGVFGTVDAATRIRLSEEDRAFALGVVRNDPIGVATIMARNIGVELLSLRIDDPLRGPSFFMREPFWRRTALPWVTPGAATCARNPRPCAARLASTPLLWLHLAAFAASLLFLLWRLTRRDVREALRSPERVRHEIGRLVGAVLLLASATLVNAVVCGALSGPYARYQARIAWLMTLCAIVVAARLGAGLRLGERSGARRAALTLGPRTL